MKTILVVEDNPYQRELYAEELEDEGYDVVCAKNGLEALQIARDRQLDLVVLDINLPDLGGFEVMTQLMEEQPRLPVVLNTAYSSYQDTFTSWMADACVVKSSDLTQLRMCIEDVLTSKEKKQTSVVTSTSTWSSLDKG